MFEQNNMYAKLKEKSNKILIKTKLNYWLLSFTKLQV